jgi:hypothetical protein
MIKNDDQASFPECFVSLEAEKIVRCITRPRLLFLSEPPKEFGLPPR